MNGAALDALLDRLLTVTAGMAFALCALTAFVIWWRILIVRPPMLEKETAAPKAPPMAAPDTKGLVVAAGVAFFGLSIGYGLRTGEGLNWLEWSSFTFDSISLLSDVAVIGSALFAVRAATVAVCGHIAVGIFAGIAGTVGVLVFFLR